MLKPDFGPKILATRLRHGYANNNDMLRRKGELTVSEDDIRVLSTPQTIRLLNLSRRTWDRLIAVGDTPVKTRVSERRVGYRLIDIRAWLDARREVA
jgi:predicted DNA-binding transcriptional regulator AlpA